MHCQIRFEAEVLWCGAARWLCLSLPTQISKPGLIVTRYYFGSSLSVVDTAWEIKQRVPVIAFITGKEKSLQKFISTVVSSVKDCIFAESCRGSQSAVGEAVVCHPPQSRACRKGCQARS